MISFIEYRLLTEAFGVAIASDFRNIFKPFEPTYKRDGRSITFDVDDTDKDGLLLHLKSFFAKRATTLKTDRYDDDVAAYKMKDDNIAVIKTPKPQGHKYRIDVKFSY